MDIDDPDLVRTIYGINKMEPKIFSVWERKQYLLLGRFHVFPLNHIYEPVVILFKVRLEKGINLLFVANF